MAIYVGIHHWPMDSPPGERWIPHKGPVMRSFSFFLCQPEHVVKHTWAAVDLSHYDAHVTPPQCCLLKHGRVIKGPYCIFHLRIRVNLGLYSLRRRSGMSYRKKSGEVSEPWNSGLRFSINFEIWQASQKQRCPDACQISEWYDQYDTQSSGDS